MTPLPPCINEYTYMTVGMSTYDNALTTIAGTCFPLVLWIGHYRAGMTAGACVDMLARESITVPRELFDRMEEAAYDAMILWSDESDIYKPGHLTKKRNATRQLLTDIDNASKKGTP